MVAGQALLDVSNNSTYIDSVKLTSSQPHSTLSGQFNTANLMGTNTSWKMDFVGFVTGINKTAYSSSLNGISYGTTVSNCFVKLSGQDEIDGTSTGGVFSKKLFGFAQQATSNTGTASLYFDVEFDTSLGSDSIGFKAYKSDNVISSVGHTGSRYSAVKSFELNVFIHANIQA